MYFIVFDLEFNQDINSYQLNDMKTSKYPYEIIQIGAIKLDQDYRTVATFNRYIKPSIYSQISSFVSELTGITSEQLLSEEPFHLIFKEFINFIGENNSIFCTWGMSDMKELYKNAEYHKLDKKLLPELYINLQPYVSTFLNLPKSQLLKLQTAVEVLDILMPYRFHNALNDAYYTAELFKIINNPSMEPKRYDPNFINIQPRQPKKIIDFDKLILQFEKMYDRELNQEEQEMIKIAYQMGKTNQFITYKSK